MLGQAQESPQADRHRGLKEEATGKHGNGEVQKIWMGHPECLLPRLIYGVTCYNMQHLLSVSIFLVFTLPVPNFQQSHESMHVPHEGLGNGVLPKAETQHRLLLPCS